jgi:hypothetical protein
MPHAPKPSILRISVPWLTDEGTSGGSRARAPPGATYGASSRRSRASARSRMRRSMSWRTTPRSARASGSA